MSENNRKQPHKVAPRSKSYDPPSVLDHQQQQSMLQQWQHESFPDMMDNSLHCHLHEQQHQQHHLQQHQSSTSSAISFSDDGRCGGGGGVAPLPRRGRRRSRDPDPCHTWHQHHHHHHQQHHHSLPPPPPPPPVSPADVSPGHAFFWPPKVACSLAETIHKKVQKMLLNSRLVRKTDGIQFLHSSDIADVHRVLGAGAFSQVSQVRTRHNGQVYACKNLKRDLMSDTKGFVTAATELAYEAHMLSSFCHPNIIKIRGWAANGIASFEEGRHDSFFLLLDLLEETLDQRIDRWNFELRPHATLQRRCRVIEKINVLQQIASALAYIHSQGVVYRDLKPQNIGFNHEGKVILFDFGLSRELPSLDCTQLFQMSGKVGTIRYMAPEVCLFQPYGASCDIYSWAMVAYEILSQGKPFEGFTPEMYGTMVCQHGVRPTDASARQYNTLSRDLEEPLSHNMVVLLQHAWSQLPEHRLPLFNIGTQLELFKQKEQLLLEAEELHEFHTARIIRRATSTVTRGSSSSGGMSVNGSVVSSTASLASVRSGRSTRSAGSVVMSIPPAPLHVVSPDQHPAQLAADLEHHLHEIEQMQAHHRHEQEHDHHHHHHNFPQQKRRKSDQQDDPLNHLSHLEEYEDIMSELGDDIEVEPLSDLPSYERKVPRRRHSESEHLMPSSMMAMSSSSSSTTMDRMSQMRQFYQRNSFDNIFDVHDAQEEQRRQHQLQNVQQPPQQQEQMQLQSQLGWKSPQPPRRHFGGGKKSSSRRHHSMSPQLAHRKDLSGRTAETSLTMDSLW